MWWYLLANVANNVYLSHNIWYGTYTSINHYMHNFNMRWPLWICFADKVTLPSLPVLQKGWPVPVYFEDVVAIPGLFCGDAWQLCCSIFTFPTNCFYIWNIFHRYSYQRSELMTTIRDPSHSVCVCVCVWVRLCVSDSVALCLCHFYSLSNPRSLSLSLCMCVPVFVGVTR